jgi:hypothetical protein
MNKFRKLCQDLGKDPRKVGFNILLLDFIILSCCLTFFFFFNQPYALMLGIAFIGVVDFYFYNSMQKEMDVLREEHESEFIGALGIFRVFAANHLNVYNAWTETRAFVSPWMQAKIDLLLKDMDEDKTVAPFIAFSHHFRPLIIEQVMTSVYQIVDGGGLSPLAQFSILFEHFAESHLKEELKKNDDQMDTMNAWPLIGAGLLAVAIIIGVVQIIGGVINEL